ncbi:hypothetical protein [Sphingomonas sp. 2378]|uniref:hypothetical protein n=1 Tax=Sphingomonas sp. 2378 TaxID=1219748 RepID=UPI00311ACC57
MDARDAFGRDGEAKGLAIIRHLVAGDGTAILEVEDDVRHGLGLCRAPAARNEALMLVERPARRDTAAGEELPCLGMKRVRGGVVARVRRAADLILLDALELPAQGVAEHLLYLLAAHAGELTIGHAQTLDCDTQSGRYSAGTGIIPRP